MKTGKPKDIGAILAKGKVIETALRKAVGEALRRHKQAGQPIVEFRNGKTVWIPPEKIRLPKATGGRRRNVGKARSA